MKVTILGNNSALPAHGRFPTSQLVEIKSTSLLVDCGEGAQMRMQQFGIRSSRIDYIFISHIHGDHYLGLVGFISSLSLMGREKTLNIFCPAQIETYIKMQIQWDLGFEIIYHFLNQEGSGILVDHKDFEVKYFPVKHSIPTYGFLFIEKKRARVLLPDKLREYEIPIYFYKRLTEGQNYVSTQGREVLNEWVTLPGPKAKSYAYCADTVFTDSFISNILDVDLLYHEATYLAIDAAKASLRMHATAMQAGMIARQANARKLIIGHFSSKYKQLDNFLEEAKTEFPNTELALEGKTFNIE